MPKAPVKFKLNPKTVAALSESGKYPDGGGLSLRIDEHGNKNWIQRVRVAKKDTTRSIGVYPDVSLAAARKSAAELLERIAAGPEPEPDVPTAPTFREIAHLFLSGWSGQYKNPEKWAREWLGTMELHVFPHLGDRPIDEVSTADVLAVLTPLWMEKRRTANMLRQRLAKILDWAHLGGYREQANPAAPYILTGLPRRTLTQRHMPSVPYDEIPDALKAVSLSTARPMTRLCLEFLVLTASRSLEARGARWDEIDLDNAVWTIPGERMKKGRTHQVPLSTHAMRVLRDARELLEGQFSTVTKTSESGLIFPNGNDEVMDRSVPLRMLQRLKVEGVVHGMRSSFRDWCGEHGISRDLAEASLAHRLGKDDTESAYYRTDLLAQRRPVMQAWADFCLGEQADYAPWESDGVVTISRHQHRHREDEGAVGSRPTTTAAGSRPTTTVAASKFWPSPPLGRELPPC